MKKVNVWSTNRFSFTMSTSDLFVTRAIRVAEIRAEVTLARAVLREVVNHGELDYRSEYESKREEDEEIESRGIRNFWQIGSGFQSEERHRQHCCYTFNYINLH